MDSPHWTNYFIDGQANADLVGALKIRGISNASYLVDPDGCVVHSNLGSITHIAVVERAIRLHERCVDAPAR